MSAKAIWRAQSLYGAGRAGRPQVLAPMTLLEHPGLTQLGYLLQTQAQPLLQHLLGVFAE